MAISFVGFASANATTVGLPSGSATGDLAIVTTGRANVAGSSIPSGWTEVDSVFTGDPGGASEHSQRTGWKVLTESDITAGNVGTWTDAAQIQVLVLRGADRVHDTNTRRVRSATTDTNFFVLGITVQQHSWVVGVSTRHTQTGTDLTDKNVTGYATRSTGTTSPRVWCGTGSTSTTDQLESGLASSSWCSRTMEVEEAYAPLAIAELWLEGVEEAEVGAGNRRRRFLIAAG